jgi:hypothetical protein
MDEIENDKYSIKSDYLFWSIAAVLFLWDIRRGTSDGMWSPLITALLMGYWITRVIRALQGKRKNRG